MGSLFSSIVGSFSSVRRAKVLMLGLDGAGKSTLLYKLKLNETVNTIPTLGFNVETVQINRHVSFTIWDLGGQKSIRQLWKHYLTGCEGLLYVVDSADKDRFSVVQEELSWILNEQEMSGVPLVVLANKQDLPRALAPDEVASKLGLPLVKDRPWYVHGTSAVSGEGLRTAIQEFSKMVKNFQEHR